MQQKSLDVAVIGSGITGLSCAWLLARSHRVSLYEKDDRFGGHSNTVLIEDEQGPVPVDTGFIVYNPETYPNLVALFEHLGVPVKTTEMSFAVSMNGGAFEYSGTDLPGLFAQPSNLVSPRFWRMLTDILRFYRNADEYQAKLDESTTLGELLARHGYSDAFRDLHLLPMGAAIWSTPADQMLDYPAQSFLRFCDNHGLLKVMNRPRWHTVDGGSRVYVERILQSLGPSAHCNRGVRSIRRLPGKVEVTDWQGESRRFDEVVLACHADQALRLLADPSDEERRILRTFRFARNRAILHSDTTLMPRRRGAWSSWNYLGRRDATGDTHLSVSYWMNRLQSLTTPRDMIVTLNPVVEPMEGRVHASYLYDHPVFDAGTRLAQRELWPMQGRQRTWFCGAWCGYGFHEDGLQAGLAVAEALGGVKRPWSPGPGASRLPDTAGVVVRASRRAA